jgi:hypothetical protein
VAFRPDDRRKHGEGARRWTFKMIISMVREAMAIVISTLISTVRGARFATSPCAGLR